MDRLETLRSLGLDLDRDQVRRLGEYEELLRERSSRLGLIAESDLPRLFERHILDSLRAASVLTDEEVCDLGSGAGLPGVPLAIALPSCEFTLCEPRRRRLGFLELVVERLELSNAAVTPSRAEELPPESADACTARAFASLGESWKAACRILRGGGRLLYFAGKGWRAPEGGTAALPEPEEPASLETLANDPPLVIMSRR
jgi:16S rRNA (guanine527-N7)-methyltransferase